MFGRFHEFSVRLVAVFPAPGVLLCTGAIPRSYSQKHSAIFSLSLNFLDFSFTLPDTCQSGWMVVTRTQLSPAPAFSTDPTDINDESSRDEFLQVRNSAKCGGCGAIGNFVLNGTHHNLQVVQCKKCSKKFTHVALRNLIGSASSVPRAPARPTKPAPVPEVSSTEFARLKTENARLLENNRNLQEQNEALHAKVDALTTKVDELLSEMRKNKPGVTAGHSVANEQQQEASVPQPSPQNPHAQKEPTQPKPDDPQQPPNPKTACQPVNWADIVNLGIAALPDMLKHLVKESPRYLQQDGFQAKRTPPMGTSTAQAIPVVVYFGNVPRGPIGKLKRCLHECLPKWAVLSISFIGASVTEILCHQPHVARLVATMCLLRYKHLAGYDPTTSAPHNATPEQARSYKAACLHRCIKLVTSARSPVCKSWYTKASEDLLADDEALDAVEPPRRNQPTPDLDKTTEASTGNNEEETPLNGAAHGPTTNSSTQDHNNDKTRNDEGFEELGSDNNIVELTPPSEDAPMDASETDN